MSAGLFCKWTQNFNVCMYVSLCFVQSSKNSDYIIKDRKLLEQLLDVEFESPIDKTGIFYKGQFSINLCEVLS